MWAGSSPVLSLFLLNIFITSKEVLPNDTLEKHSASIHTYLWFQTDHFCVSNAFKSYLPRTRGISHNTMKHSSRMRTARVPMQTPPSGHVACDACWMLVCDLWCMLGSQRPSLPVDRQTPVKTLPCLKLRLRVLENRSLLLAGCADFFCTSCPNNASICEGCQAGHYPNSDGGCSRELPGHSLVHVWCYTYSRFLCR